MPGAYGYEVNQTLNGGTFLDFSATSVNGPRWDSHWPLEGSVYTISVRAVAGQDRAGPWSPTVTVTAHPQLAPGPTNVNLVPTNDGFNLNWDPPTGPYTGDMISEYYVLFWDTDSCDYLGGMAVTNSPVSIPAKGGHHIFVAVITWNINGEGFPEILSNVMPGITTAPNTPSGLSVMSPNEFDAHLTWNNIPYAAGYDILIRDIRDGANHTLQPGGDTRVNCYNEGFIFAFVEWYEFCIQAYNGNLRSPIDESQCVTATKPVSTAPVPTCSVYPGWCANGPPADTYTSTVETGTIPGPDKTAAPTSTSAGSPNPTSTSSGSSTSTSQLDQAEEDQFNGETGISCDYSQKFNDLDALNTAASNYEAACLSVYSLQALISMLDTAYDNYTSVNDGYDEEFGYYMTYIKNLVPVVLDTNFMFNGTNKANPGAFPPLGYGMNCKTLSRVTMKMMDLGG